MVRATSTGTPRKPLSYYRSGVTFVELLIVLVVITVLAALTMPAITQSRAAAVKSQCSNNMRNVALGLISVADQNGRYPACGNFGRETVGGPTLHFHTWVVDVLPWLEQRNISDQWDKDKPLTFPANSALTTLHAPVLTCPSDITVSRRSASRRGDLSYVVNGGVGFTVERSPGVHDCPIDWHSRNLDLNGNGVTCPSDDALDGPSPDRTLFKSMGLFFNETWEWDITVRHHTPASITDGLSHTMLVSENVRTGFDPSNPSAGWSSSSPWLTSFYIGNPCGNSPCVAGSIDYALSNSGDDAINSGLTRPEGESPVPNSFHLGGVNMGFCDGRIIFLNQHIEGAVYAALASPDGESLAGTPLEQPSAQPPE